MNPSVRGGKKIKFSPPFSILREYGGKYYGSKEN